MSKIKFKHEGLNVEIDEEIIKEFPNAQSAIKQSISDAVKESINEMGIEQFKKTSFFVSNNGSNE
jgi:DNA-binding protein YbaB